MNGGFQDMLVGFLCSEADQLELLRKVFLWITPLHSFNYQSAQIQRSVTSHVLEIQPSDYSGFEQHCHHRVLQPLPSVVFVTDNYTLCFHSDVFDLTYVSSYAEKQ